MPEARIFALVPKYTREVANLSDAIDEIILDPGPGQPGGSALSLAARLRKEKFSTVITLFSTIRVGAAVRLAGIPVRLAPATKLAQVFYNQRIPQRRSHSIKPEYEYNSDLVRSFLVAHDRWRDDELVRPLIRIDSKSIKRTRAALGKELGLPIDLPWVFIHPHSGGSAGNLSIQQYADLGRRLLAEHTVAFVITAGPGEIEDANRLAQELSCPYCAVYDSQLGLQRFIEVLATADLFVGGSTGPLHLAGALDRPTAGFYPRRKTSSPLRWQTLNQPEKRLSFVPPLTADERDVSSIDVTAAAAKIGAQFLT